jgi:MFS family permease
MGFLVDRVGGRLVLMSGLALMSLSFLAVGVTLSYWEVLALFALAGIGNSVFHPADYAIMAARLGEDVFGRAVGVHTFTGYLGWAAAALIMLPLAQLLDWRSAIAAAGAAGMLIVLVMLGSARFLDDRQGRGRAPGAKGGEKAGGLRAGVAPIRSMPMVMMFAFFTLTAAATAGIMAFSVVASVTLHGVDKIVAGGALTAHLVASAAGVLIGGWLADRTHRHNLTASLAIAAMAGFFLLLAFDGLAALVMVAAMVLGGLSYGISSPSRDVLVKRATPEGSAGVTFGFTSTGLSVGNLIGPLLCGWIMDLGQPRLFFIVVAAIIAASIVAVALTRVRDAATDGVA